MSQLDAYSITSPCGGLATIRACEDEEVRREQYAERREAMYLDSYDSVPSRYRGSLLLEAVSELTQGETLDDQIVDAYAKGDDQAMVCAMRTLLNNYRRQIAERETVEAMAE